MASYIDAANGLADAIAALLAPDTNGVIALTGAVAKIYVGWPDKQTLDADLKTGTAHISVWPLPGERMVSVTKADMDWVETGAALASRETQRRARAMQIGIWCNTFGARDLIGDAIEGWLADMFRLALSDGTTALVSWTGGQLIDDKQLLNLYRRDAMVMVTYSTLQTMAATPIEQTQVAMDAQVNGATIGSITLTTP
ncbi:hypothetical protein J2792_002337 [Novosphingobium capsulatum]|uniref:Bacteriophage protein n=1 Tax=Novosphingobium capsulatum TaxID=13688 RepID=A0ABU1MMA2_9SPHN|nr:hypothetical protein [Novosphingobium capsulatum]MDR6511465.1 hypothetical protein [Novosphingobium capsulatum]